MRIIAIKRLKDFWKKYPDSETSLRAWYYEAKKAKWQSPNEIKIHYPSASVLKNNIIVFNIKGNDYRMIAAIKYDFGFIYIRFLGTHAEYDKINAKEI